MKVGFTTYGVFPYIIGGIQRHSTFLANTLTKLGIDVTVIHPGGKGDTNLPFLFKEVIIPYPSNLQYIHACYEFSKRIKEYLEKNNNFDLLYGQGFTLWAYLKQKKRPVIYNPHGLEMYQTLHFKDTLKAIPFRFMASYHAKYSDKVISLGGKLTDIIKDKLKVAPNKIAIIPNGVEPSYFQDTTTYEKIPNSLLFVGRLEYNKGVQYLIEAFNHLINEDITLFIVGDGPLLNSLKKLSKNSKVKFLSKVEDKELKKLYKKVDALIFTSLYEGMPTVILEAMINKLPVIATDIGAVSIMVNSENGFIIPHSSKEAIIKAVKDFFKLDKREREKLGEISYKKVIENFTWESVAKKSIKLFEEILSSYG